MNDFRDEIEAALSGDDAIPREHVLRWIDATDDIHTLSKLYRLTGESYGRIQSELGKESECALVQRYLLECIRQNVTDNDDIEDRWSAAQILHAWFCKLAEFGDAGPELEKAAVALTQMFLEGDENIREAIEQGFLEHALEMAALRPLFESWSSDERLRPTWNRAIEWGLAHPGFLWDLLNHRGDWKDLG